MLFKRTPDDNFRDPVDYPFAPNYTQIADGEGGELRRHNLDGARRFPSLVPLFPDAAEVEENKAAWEVLKRFDKTFMCAFSDDDPVTAGGDKPFLEQVPGCRGVKHRTISPAGHFLQQDQPGQCVQAILDITGRA